MSQLQTIRRVTVYADATLGKGLIGQFQDMGAKGYTVMDCRGKGKREVMDDPFGGPTRVRIELLVRPEVGEKIIAYLDQAQFRRKAVAACLETVQVAADEAF